MDHRKAPRASAEEIVNASTHAVAALVAAAATALLCIEAVARGAVAVVSVSIFGGSMVLLFSASALYHALSHSRAAGWLQALDHLAIYLLIVGSYTPFCLLAIRGWLGWTVFGVVSGLALVGVIARLVAPRSTRQLSIALYLVMGWIGLLAALPLIRAIGAWSFAWVATGGIAYTVGLLFYLQKRRAWMHTLWHLFVMAGAALHCVAVFQLFR